jgi:hypothetical protein
MEGTLVFSELPYRTTMQHFVQDSCRLPLFDHDAYLIDTADIPPAIILDFIYGIVAYHHWKSNEDPPDTLLRYFDEQHYKLALHRAPRIPIDDFDSDLRTLHTFPRATQGRVTNEISKTQWMKY